MALCVLVGIGVVAFWPGEREPEYKGKKLSEWLKIYSSRFQPNEDFPGPRGEEATDAIQHIGTNAIPWAVKWMAYERPAWKTKVQGIVWKIPAKPIRQWWVKNDRLRGAATATFEVLGTNASAAAPELARIVRTSPTASTRDAAMWALSDMGKDGLPFLLAALENQDTKSTATMCISVMGERGIDIGPAIPAFLLMDREAEKQARKFEKDNPGPIYHNPNPPLPALSGLLIKNSALLIPPLTNCLHHTNDDVRAEAAHVLGLIGERARPTVPALKEALNDRVVAVQEAALEALKKIAPEVLTNGVKDY